MAIKFADSCPQGDLPNRTSEYLFEDQSQPTQLRVPSRKLTYPTLGKGKSSSQVPFVGGYVIVPRRAIWGCPTVLWSPTVRFTYLRPPWICGFPKDRNEFNPGLTPVILDHPKTSRENCCNFHLWVCKHCNDFGDLGFYSNPGLTLWLKNQSPLNVVVAKDTSTFLISRCRIVKLFYL